MIHLDPKIYREHLDTVTRVKRSHVQGQLLRIRFGHPPLLKNRLRSSVSILDRRPTIEIPKADSVGPGPGGSVDGPRLTRGFLALASRQSRNRLRGDGYV